MKLKHKWLNATAITALLLAPVPGMAVELTYIETESLKVGDKVFQPDAVAFTANGQSVTCAEVAFHIAQAQPACFAVLTEEDIREIRLLGGQGRNFTTMSGLSFVAGSRGVAGSQGIVGLTEDGQSFAVAGAGPAPGTTADDMTEVEIAVFLGLDSAAQLGGAVAGLDAGAGGVTASTTAVVNNGTGSLSANVDGDADVDGGTLSVSADADADTGTGGISADVHGDADVDGGGGSVGAEASAGVSSGGTSVSGSGSAGASTGSGGTGVGVGGGVDASVGGTGAGVGAGAAVGIGG